MENATFPYPLTRVLNIIFVSFGNAVAIFLLGLKQVRFVLFKMSL
jgi:hypothetical protein